VPLDRPSTVPVGPVPVALRRWDRAGGAVLVAVRRSVLLGRPGVQFGELCCWAVLVCRSEGCVGEPSSASCGVRVGLLLVKAHVVCGLGCRESV